MKKAIRRRIPYFRMLFLSLLILSSMRLVASQDKAEKIIEKSIEAQGGQQFLEKINDSVILTTNKIYTPQGEILTERKIYTKRNPSKLRIEETVMGMQIVIGYDGKKLWMEQMGKVMIMSDNFAQAIKTSLKREDLLLRYKEKGYKAEYMGEAEVENKKCYQIKITDNEGEETIYYFDSETYLPLKLEFMAPDETGKMVKNEIINSDFRKVKNIVTAFRSVSYVDGRKVMETSVKEININQGLDDKLFQMPEKNAPSWIS